MKTFFSKTENINPLAGDLSLNVIDHDGNNQVESHLNLLFQSDYIPVTASPWENHINTNSFSDCGITKCILKVDVSDHGPVFFIFKETDIYWHNEVVYITRSYI